MVATNDDLLKELKQIKRLLKAGYSNLSREDLNAEINSPEV